MKIKPNTKTNQPQTLKSAHRAAISTTAGEEGVKSGVSSETLQPTDLEIAQLAAVMSIAPQHQGKSEQELAYKAFKLYQAIKDLRQAQPERDLLLATVAKMSDENGLLGSSADTKGKSKEEQRITTAWWLERMRDYSGDKYDLLKELLFTRVSETALLKELFPRARVSRKQLLKELLSFEGKPSASSFVSKVVGHLVIDRPDAERRSLLAAIQDGSLTEAEKWLDEIGCDKFARLIFFFLLINLENLRDGQDLNTLRGVSPLLARWLIFCREKQISTIYRANAMKEKK